MSDHYKVGQWKGKTKYRCNYCAYDSSSEEVIADHIRSRHMPQFSIRPAEGGLVSDKGDPLHVVEEYPPEGASIVRGDEHPTDAGESAGNATDEKTGRSWFRGND